MKVHDERVWPDEVEDGPGEQREMRCHQVRLLLTQGLRQRAPCRPEPVRQRGGRWREGKGPVGRCFANSMGADDAPAYGHADLR